MTKQEFLDDVTWWDDLIIFCNDIGTEHCSNIYDEDEIDELITNRIDGMLRTNDSWKNIADFLSDIPRDCCWYCENDYGDIIEADDYVFMDIKEEVEDYCDRYELWDDEEEEEPISDSPEEECEPIEEEFGIEELFNSCVGLKYSTEEEE